uniref:Uncharacterized protein n=1 Tax=Parascaris univalens TaxID=6257 RepID=A0A915BDL6_PARUN
EKLIYEYFVILSQLLSSIDDKVFITREVEDQLALVAVARELHSVFYCYILKLNEAPPLEWRDQVLQADGSMWDGCIKLSSQLIHFGRFELHKQRQEYGRIVKMQKMLRELGASGKEPNEELHLDLSEGENVGKEALNIDRACIIVQTWERGEFNSSKCSFQCIFAQLLYFIVSLYCLCLFVAYMNACIFQSTGDSNR